MHRAAFGKSMAPPHASKMLGGPDGAVKPVAPLGEELVDNMLDVVAHVSELLYGIRVALEAVVNADLNGTSGITTQAFSTSVLMTVDTGTFGIDVRCSENTTADSFSRNHIQARVEGRLRHVRLPPVRHRQGGAGGIGAERRGPVHLTPGSAATPGRPHVDLAHLREQHLRLHEGHGWVAVRHDRFEDHRGIAGPRTRGVEVTE